MGALRLLSVIVCLGFLLAAWPLAPNAQASLLLLDTYRLDDPKLGASPWAVAACAATGRVYVSCIQGPHALIAIDSASDSIVGSGTITGPYPKGLDVSADGARVYVASSGGTLSIVDAATLEEIHVVPIDGSLRDVCVYEPASGAGKLYVTDRTNARVVVLAADGGGLLTTIPVGAYPEQVRVNPVTERIYVTNLSDWTVSVIDATIDQTIATIPVGAYPLGLGIDPALNLVYVVNRDDNSCSVIHGATHAVLATYPVGESPRSVAVDPETHLAYVTNRDGNDLSVLNADGPLALWRPLGLGPEGIAIAPGSGRVYTANHDSDDLSAFDSGSLGNSAAIRLRIHAADVALAPHVGSESGPMGHAQLLVANGRGNSVHRMAPWFGSSSRVYDADYRITDIAARERDSLVAAVASERGLLLLFDGQSGEILAEAQVGTLPWGLCMRADRERIYVANYGSEDLAVYDITTGTVIKSIDFGFHALDVAVNEATDRIYVTTWWGLLWMLDGSTHEILDSVSLSGFCEFDQLAVDPVRNLVYVAAVNCYGYQVVDGQTLAIVGGGSLPDYPGGVAVNRARQHAYICNGRYLSVIGPQHTVVENLTLPGSAYDCVAEECSGRVFVSAAEEGIGSVVYVVYDGDPSEAPAGDATAAGLPGRSAHLRLRSPNPAWLPAAGPVTEAVRFEISHPPASGGVLAIYDVHGRCVHRAGTPVGASLLTWDGRDLRKQPVAAGAYYARWQTGQGVGPGTALRVVILR